MKDIIEALDLQLREIKINDLQCATADSMNKIIKALGGDLEVDVYSNTQAVCVYVTTLAIKKLFKEG